MSAGKVVKLGRRYGDDFTGASLGPEAGGWRWSVWQGEQCNGGWVATEADALKAIAHFVVQAVAA